jgi:hypothetical protein
MAVGQTLAAQRADEEVTYYDYPNAPQYPSVYPNGGTVPGQYGGFALESMTSDGAWIATPIDFVHFQARIDGRGGPALLSAASITAMTANPKLPVGQPDGTTQPGDNQRWYGLGWAANIWNNWWHYGDLPGSISIQVHAGNGYGWAIFLNSRPAQYQQLEYNIDDAMWNALNGTTTWPTDDWFDQYSEPFSAWMTFNDYQAAFDTANAANRFPTHVEGKLVGATPMFRARFAPFRRAGRQAMHGADCTTFTQRDALQKSLGMSLVSLQSFVDATGHRQYQAVWEN